MRERDAGKQGSREEGSVQQESRRGKGREGGSEQEQRGKRKQEREKGHPLIMDLSLSLSCL